MKKDNAIVGMYRKHERVIAPLEGESTTHQSFKDECDINNIMKKFEMTGIMEHARRFEGQYGDFISAPDYHTAMNAIVLAQEMFMAIPSKIRQRFANDPSLFLEFVQNPDNVEEMKELGLLTSVGLDPAMVQEEKAEPKKQEEASAKDPPAKPKKGASDASPD